MVINSISHEGCKAPSPGVVVAYRRSAEETHLEHLLSIIEHACKGVYATRAQQADEHGKFVYLKREGTLAEDDLRGHLNAGPFLAVYPMLDGGVVEVAVLDLDDHDGTLGFDKVCATAQQLLELARDHGLVGWCVRSGGGIGIHIWFFWNNAPQSVPQVRQVLGDILASAGLAEGAGGVAKKQVEIFPSGAVDGLGKAIALPFARQSVPLGLDLATVDIQPMWTTSEPIDVEVRAAPVRKQNFALPPFGDVLAALEVVPNDDLDYESSWKVLAATAASTGKSPEGLEAALVWSRQSSKHDEATTRKKWSSVKEDRSGFGALINLAREQQAGWQPPSWLGVSPYSEQWLALRFVAENAATSRYTAEANQWHHWDGNRWAKDRTLKAFSMAQEVCKRAATPNRGSKDLFKAKTRAAVVSLARENPLLAATIEQWDADPWLLGTPSGVVDLRTGKLHAGDANAMITMSTTCAPGGGCPLWIKTVGEIFSGDQEVIGYVQRWLGYCLTGSVREEKFIFAYGTGRNGKGTFWETVRHVLGDYAGTVPLATLLAMKQHGHETEIMAFKGKRLMVANEPNENDRLDSARIKWFTGGDQMTGRFMRCDPIAFEPTHKLVISGNHQPRFGQVDTALEERINVLGFSAFFDEAKRDLTLKARLRDEGSGILAWCVAGCLEWQRQGLNPPCSVRVQSKKMMAEASDLAVFLDEMCQEAVGSSKVPDVFARWSGWQLRRGRDPGSKKAFTLALKNAGFVVEPGHAKTPYVQGLLLLESSFADF